MQHVLRTGAPHAKEMQDFPYRVEINKEPVVLWCGVHSNADVYGLTVCIPRTPSLQCCVYVFVCELIYKNCFCYLGREHCRLNPGSIEDRGHRGFFTGALLCKGCAHTRLGELRGSFLSRHGIGLGSDRSGFRFPPMWVPLSSASCNHPAFSPYALDSSGHTRFSNCCLILLLRSHAHTHTLTLLSGYCTMPTPREHQDSICLHRHRSD